MPTAAAYALATLAPDGRRLQYLSRAANHGNMMRTSDPFSARTWPSVPELECWIDDLPETAKDQIGGRDLHVVPLTFHVGDPVTTLVLRVLKSPEAEAPTLQPQPR